MRLLARIPKPAGATVERAIAAAVVERSTTRAVPVPRPATPTLPIAETKAKPKKPEKVDEPAGDPLAQPTYTLPGIGPAFAERLAEKGLVTVEDLLWCLPRRYDDVRDAKSLADACAMDEGQRATFAAKVASSRMVFVRGRRWAEVRLGGIDLTDKSNSVVRWFRSAPYSPPQRKLSPAATSSEPRSIPARSSRSR
jgi:hypothetical protein